MHSVGINLAADKSDLQAWTSIFGSGVIFGEIQEHWSTGKYRKMLQPRGKSPLFRSRVRASPEIMGSLCDCLDHHLLGRADRATTMPHSLISCNAWRQCHHLDPCCPVRMEHQANQVQYKGDRNIKSSSQSRRCASTSTHPLTYVQSSCYLFSPAMLSYTLELMTIQFPGKQRKWQKENVNMVPVFHNWHTNEPGNLGQSTSASAKVVRKVDIWFNW